MHRSLPPLHALRAFEAAARHGSFTRAAEELNLTQGAVSHRIRALEDRLGRALFRRAGRGVAPTAAGEAYLPVVRGAFDLLVEGTERVFGGAESDGLTLSLTPAFAMGWLIPRLGGFQARHPGIEVRITTTQRLVDLAREDVDLAIRSGLGDWPGMRADRLFGYDLAPVCSPGLRDRDPLLATPADLARHRLLHSATDPDDWGIWLAAAGAPPVETYQGQTFETLALSLSAAYAELGVAIAPAAFIDEDLAEGWLVKPFAFTARLDEGFYLVCPEASTGRPAIAAFRDWILAEAAETRRDADAAPA